MTEALLAPGELAELEARVQRALATGSTEELDVLGYGEITLVAGWPTGTARVAAKRLPPFADHHSAQRYGELVSAYLDALRQRGITPVASQWHTTPTSDAQVAGYVVQPALDAASLGLSIGRHDQQAAAAMVAEALDVVAKAVDPGFGLDAQLSNWAMVDGSLRYLDVTTPLLAETDGRTRLDLGLLTSPLPALLRPAVRRFVAPGIVAAYHRPRDVAVDLIGNLVKDRLDHLVDDAIAEANRWVGPAITRDEIDRWYRSNARLWEVMLRLRRADAWWQQRVRRRPPAFLLPGPIER